MTDIVERLRKFCKWPEPGDGIPEDPVFANVPDLKEAADEIERLRAERDMWRQENLKKQVACEQMGARVVALEARVAAARREGIEAAADEAGKLAHGLTPDLNNYEAGYANGALDCERVIRALLGDGR